MSAMSSLYLQIEEMLDLALDPRTIAQRLEIPISWVYEVAEEASPEFDQ